MEHIDSELLKHLQGPGQTAHLVLEREHYRSAINGTRGQGKAQIQILHFVALLVHRGWWILLRGSALRNTNAQKLIILITDK